MSHVRTLSATLLQEAEPRGQSSLLAALGKRMANVFVSYAHEDRLAVQQLVAFLRAKDFKVQWDQDWVGGEPLNGTVQEAIRGSGMVIVVWTEASISSDWVLSEATLALRTRGKLLPVRLEKVEPPPPFTQIHTLDLSGWIHSGGEPEWQALVRGLDRWSRRRVRHALAFAALLVSSLAVAAVAYRHHACRGADCGDAPTPGVAGSAGAAPTSSVALARPSGAPTSSVAPARASDAPSSSVAPARLASSSSAATNQVLAAAASSSSAAPPSSSGAPPPTPLRCCTKLGATSKKPCHEATCAACNLKRCDE